MSRHADRDAQIISSFLSGRFNYCEIASNYGLRPRTVERIIRRRVDRLTIISVLKSVGRGWETSSDDVKRLHDSIVDDYVVGKITVPDLSSKYKMVSGSVYRVLHGRIGKDGIMAVVVKRGYMPLGRFRKLRHAIWGRVYSLKNDSVVHYRSSLEKKAIAILEGWDDVLSYDYEFLSISCKGYGQRGNGAYIPDFVVRYRDGRVSIVEVKPERMTMDAKCICKFEAAQEYCRQHKMSFEVWDENVLGILGNKSVGDLGFEDFVW